MSRAVMQQALEALEGFDHFRRIMTDGPDESDKVFAEDHAEVAFVTAARVIPALKQALAEPEQEPVAYFDPQEKGFYWAKPTAIKAPMTVSIEPLPLYSAPTPRKPLKEDEIADLWDGHTVPVFGKIGINPIVFARAIERAHGIGDSNGS